MGSLFTHVNWGGKCEIECIDEENINVTFADLPEEWMTMTSMGWQSPMSLPREDLIHFERID